MKTVQVEVFSFAELSDKAKAKAHCAYLSSGFEYAWVDESMDSVKAYVDFFGGKVGDWELSTYAYSYIDAELKNVRGISPKKCPEFLTGGGIDETFRIAFLNYAVKHGDVRGAIKSAIDACTTDIVRDMEHQESLDAFADNADSNEWQFTQTGDFWH